LTVGPTLALVFGLSAALKPASRWLVGIWSGSPTIPAWILAVAPLSLRSCSPIALPPSVWSAPTYWTMLAFCVLRSSGEMMTLTENTGIFAWLSAATLAAPGPEFTALRATAQTPCWTKLLIWESWVESLSLAMATLTSKPFLAPLSMKLWRMAT